jgi:hypothetical protein
MSDNLKNVKKNKNKNTNVNKHKCKLKIKYKHEIKNAYDEEIRKIIIKLWRAPLAMSSAIFHRSDHGICASLNGGVRFFRHATGNSPARANTHSQPPLRDTRDTRHATRDTQD